MASMIIVQLNVFQIRHMVPGQVVYLLPANLKYCQSEIYKKNV